MQIGFFGTLFFILLILKLIGAITISWGWLLLILCAPVLLIIGIIIVPLLIYLSKE